MTTTATNAKSKQQIQPLANLLSTQMVGAAATATATAMRRKTNAETLRMKAKNHFSLPGAISAIVLLICCQSGDCLVVRTPATSAYVKEYVRRLPSGSSSVVAMGGWDAVERKAIGDLAAKNFESVKDRIPRSHLDVVKAGGWSALQALSADPKGALLELIRMQLNQPAETKSEFARKNDDGVSLLHLDAIVALLQAQGRGFESDLVDGDWNFVLQRQSNKSPAFQKLVSKGEKAGNTQSNFDVRRGKFDTVVSLLRGWIKLVATVKYMPLAENFDVIKRGTIVLRRIACDIVGGYLKVWKLPGLPLPLRVKGGYLDFLYLDKDLRVTRGNRGGLFVHVRPETLRELASSAAA